MRECCHEWRHWLSIFLHFFVLKNMEAFLDSASQLFIHMLAMCKRVIATADLQGFWRGY